jgi:uncharacterized repeat protein (TIGR03803 family)
MVNSFEIGIYGNYIFTNGGSTPVAGLILSGNILYGTASRGGSSDFNSSSGNGTVFAIKTNGTGFTNLYGFTAIDPNTGGNSDGAAPLAGLILSGNTLYGTAIKGGTNGNGTIFAINTNGSGFTNLHSFTAANYDASFNITNSDGTFPAAGLILSGNTLYGTASRGGSSGNGTVFAIKTDGTGVTNLHSFTFTALSGSYPGPYTNSDGASPQAGLILLGNTLYGTASAGGGSGNGTVFSLSLGSVSAPPPQLTIIPSGANVILTWPTNATGFTLQSTTNLVSPAVWATGVPGPVVVNGQNTVTNPIAGTQMFYRLSQ